MENPLTPLVYDGESSRDGVRGGFSHGGVDGANSTPPLGPAGFEILSRSTLALCFSESFRFSLGS